MIDDRPITVAVVEDDDAIRRSLTMIVDGSPGYVCAHSYGRAEDAIRDLPQHPPDVVLMDVGLPGMSGVDATRILRERIPDIDVVMLTVQEDDETIFDSLCAGATGYLVKGISPAIILQSIDEVHRGGSPMSASIARRVIRSFQSAAETPSLLSTREREILEHLCDGENYRVIAERLFISGHTVRAHIKNIYQKLHVNTRAAAVRKAMREGLV